MVPAIYQSIRDRSAELAKFQRLVGTVSDSVSALCSLDEAIDIL